MRKHAIAVVAGIASAGLLSVQSSALALESQFGQLSDFQTRFGHQSEIDFNDPLQAWADLNYGQFDSDISGITIESSLTKVDVGFDVPVAETEEGQLWGGGIFDTLNTVQRQEQLAIT